jgi:hypothetical protein
VERERKVTGTVTDGEIEGDKIHWSHIDATGRQVIFSDLYWRHSQNDERPLEGDVISAMNNVLSVATHKNGDGRLVVLAKNNIVMIYDGGQILTAVKRKSASDAKEYFLNTSENPTLKVKKWQIGKLLSALARTILFAKKG